MGEENIHSFIIFPDIVDADQSKLASWKAEKTVVQLCEQIALAHFHLRVTLKPGLQHSGAGWF
jgi:hypothetical protein